MGCSNEKKIWATQAYTKEAHNIKQTVFGMTKISPKLKYIFLKRYKTATPSAERSASRIVEFYSYLGISPSQQIPKVDSPDIDRIIIYTNIIIFMNIH